MCAKNQISLNIITALLWKTTDAKSTLSNPHFSQYLLNHVISAFADTHASDRRVVVRNAGAALGPDYCLIRQLNDAQLARLIF